MSGPWGFGIRFAVTALVLATASSLAALVSGHLQANNVYHYQPAKLAAFEGHYQTCPADLSLVGIPDDETESWCHELSPAVSPSLNGALL